MVLAGIECSQKSVIFANGIPVQKRVEKFDTRKCNVRLKFPVFKDEGEEKWKIAELPSFSPCSNRGGKQIRRVLPRAGI